MDYDHADTKMADWLEDKIEATKKACGSLVGTMKKTVGSLVETMKKACGIMKMCQNSGPSKFNINWGGLVKRFFTIIKIYNKYCTI